MMRKASSGIEHFFRERKQSYAKTSVMAQGTDSCAICVEEFGDEDEVAALNCAENHIFHTRCIATWFRQAANTEKTCPMCRKAITITYSETVFDL